jgi:dephospho-CoA kinase
LQVIVVICERDLQLQRLIERHLSERESILLIDTQMKQEEKAAR